MNEVLKKRWVEALLSDRYKQGTNYLRCDDRFCCLGVLCDLYNSEGWSDDERFMYESNFSDEMPPDSVLTKVGLPVRDACHLAEMNDAGESFGAIAKYIQEEL